MGHWQVIDGLLRNCAEVSAQININAQTNNGNTALHCAIRNGHLEAVKLL
ncbi:MAG: hypothetical protein PG981_001104 [Wolbachia endosymbiont of Ctenocephalides orientis wCori]|nr:MAG: hypothetical protein PG981_001104 [Wolbachia endosymbiont of Ctenocephalides orientis wCori]